MEKKLTPIVCLDEDCLQMPIFAHDYQHELHSLHSENTIDQEKLVQFLKPLISSPQNEEEMLVCYQKLYQFDKIKEEIQYEMECLQEELQQQHVNDYLPTFSQIFRPLRQMEEFNQKNISHIQKVKEIIALDTIGPDQVEPREKKICEFQVKKTSKKFVNQIEQTFETLSYKLKILKRKKLELIDQLLRMNTQIGEVKIKQEDVQGKNLKRKQKSTKRENEIKDIITQLQIHQQKRVKPNEDLDLSQNLDPQNIDQQNVNSDFGTGMDKAVLDDNQDQNVNDIDQVLGNIDQSKIVFTGNNRFFIRRTQEEQINILCQAIQSPNISEILNKYLVCTNSIKAWRQKYLGQCLDILQSKNIFFIRRKGWDRDAIEANETEINQN